MCWLPNPPDVCNPGKVHETLSGKREFFFTITIWFLLLTVIAPACASPFPVVIRGTILELNKTDQTLLLLADCEQSWCQVNVTGMYKGQIPSTPVLSSLKKGEMVEAVFNAWYMDLHDPSTGYVNPSDEVRDIRTWRAVEKLAYGANTSEFVGTDVFGDTAYLAAPLAGGYSVEYDIRGPPPAEYDFRITPPGTTANITLKRDTGVAGTWSLKAGESFNYTDPSDNSFVSVTFVGGYRPDTYGLESCPCTDLTVRILSDETTGTHVIPVASSPVPTQKAPALPALLTLALGGVIIIRGLRRDPR
ncbi:MAG: hypothetical protein LUQ12_01395 [Methanoregulaceae archaeon]|nr:hypothetical protein [Methanoregulaceae archaeon]